MGMEIKGDDCMIKQIGHNALRVSDMGKSVAFYQDIVGMTKEFEVFDEANNPWIVYLRAGEKQFLELFYDGVRDHSRDYDGKKIGYHHFCVEVEDLEKTGQRLLDAGYINNTATQPGRDHNQGYWINDPDGNAVEFVCYSPKSPHVLSNKGERKKSNLPISGIAHVTFATEDMGKSLHFYQNILGFERIYDMPDDDGNDWLIYLRVCDGQCIELFYNGEIKYSPKTENPTGFMHLCLEVENIEKIAEHLRKNGITLTVEPLQGKDHNWQCWANDPDGNPIEFMQIDPKSPQAQRKKKEEQQ